MNRIVTLLLLGSLWIPIATRAAEDLGVIVLGPEEELAERLGIDEPGRTWVAVDGGMIRPLENLAGIDPGLHDLLLMEREESGEIVAPRWVTVDVVDPLASGRDAYPLTYLVDRRPPRLDPKEPPFIRPNDALPVAAYDESGIRELSYLVGATRHDVASPHQPWAAGRHTVTVEGVDRAGNAERLSLTFEVDDTPPSIDISGDDRVEDNGIALTVRGRGELSVSATDDRSGVASLLFRIDDDRWRGVRGPLEIDDDIGAIEFLASDNAGNQRIVRREVRR